MLGSGIVPSPTTRSLLTSEARSGFYFSLDVASARLITFPTIVRSVVRVLVGSRERTRVVRRRERGRGGTARRSGASVEITRGSLRSVNFCSFCRNPDLNIWTPTWLLHRCVDKPSLALPPAPPRSHCALPCSSCPPPACSTQLSGAALPGQRNFSSVWIPSRLLFSFVIYFPSCPL